MSNHFAVVLYPGTSQLLELLREYLQTQDTSMLFVLCTDIQHTDRFLRCRLVQNTSRKLDWVQIPYDRIVAIVELAVDRPVGFLGENQ